MCVLVSPPCCGHSYRLWSCVLVEDSDSPLPGYIHPPACDGAEQGAAAPRCPPRDPGTPAETSTLLLAALLWWPDTCCRVRISKKLHIFQSLKCAVIWSWMRPQVIKVTHYSSSHLRLRRLLKTFLLLPPWRLLDYFIVLLAWASSTCTALLKGLL